MPHERERSSLNQKIHARDHGWLAKPAVIVVDGVPLPDFARASRVELQAAQSRDRMLRAWIGALGGGLHHILVPVCCTSAGGHRSGAPHRLCTVSFGFGGSNTTAWSGLRAPPSSSVECERADTPDALARPRVLQCVAFPGFVSSVLVTMSSIRSSPILRGAPHLGSSSRPSRRCRLTGARVRRRCSPDLIGAQEPLGCSRR
jgi:hypothetical protein